jgi:hypothetical protein|tara:strand:+ start:239 stop:628 length:390 start_codon:yes stop_codon:yes gene_type:complete
MSDFEIKSNTGFLWSESNVKVIYKGKVVYEIANDKGDPERKEIYASVLRYEDRTGNIKYELVRSVGLLHRNLPEDKRSPKTPDLGGKITLDGVEYKFGSYINESEKGTEYLKVFLQNQETEEKKDELGF